MKRILVVVVFGLALAAAVGARAATNEAMLGFTRDGAARQRTLEAQFDASLKREDLRDWMQRITAHPHHLGSAYDKSNADFILGLFRSWGYDAELEQFEVLFPTPKTRLLELNGPEKFTAKLEEPALKEDATSGQKSEQLPTYNVYSPDGDVTGELVYVNYGVPKDYETLAEKGVSVKGKIVIARYGGSWRGIKPKVAAEHGAIGCLIYSDPKDDGYAQGDVYPEGAFRNEDGVQRGSVQDMVYYPGDPLTPGVGATKDAKRLAIKDAITICKIPVQPISYGDALPLLRSLRGPVAPAEWRGALPVTYHLGPSTVTAHLKLAFNWDMATAYDVVAKMRGSERPDEWVIRGNHYDAWVCGADDPVSGAVALLDEAHGLSELAKSGWKPKRTVIFTVWDGEEPGLIGSTEWVETHATELKQHAAVYVNSDNNARGFLHVGGSHTLEKFVNEISRDVMDPERKIPVGERLRDERLVRTNAAGRKEQRNRADWTIEALGSGSDYSPFLQHLGIASLDFRYGGEGVGGSYHSIYDSFDHFTRFVDPNFEYGLALARTSGRAVLRLADADYLPFEFGDSADTIGKYVESVTKLADDMREETREMNRLIRDKALLAAADPTQPFVEPAPKDEVPFLNFAPLHNALAKLQESARQFEATRKAMEGSGSFPSRDAQTALDEALMKTERALTREQGLPRRPWYQHMIYAPGFYTGYGVKTLPGVREAIEERKWAEAGEQIEAVSKTIEGFAGEIDRAGGLLRGR